MTTANHFPLKLTQFYDRSQKTRAAYQTLRTLQAVTTS